MDQMLARGWGLLSVAPQSMSSIHRSEEKSNSPLTFGMPSGRVTLSPMPPGAKTAGSGATRVGAIGVVCALKVTPPCDRIALITSACQSLCLAGQLLARPCELSCDLAFVRRFQFSVLHHGLAAHQQKLHWSRRTEDEGTHEVFDARMSEPVNPPECDIGELSSLQGADLRLPTQAPGAVDRAELQRLSGGE